MMKAKEAMEILLKLDKDEDVIVNIIDKTDVEDDLGYELTNEKWLEFIETFENDEMMNDQRAMAWMEALESIREEEEVEA
jgi:hypothetical protein